MRYTLAVKFNYEFDFVFIWVCVNLFVLFLPFYFDLFAFGDRDRDWMSFIDLNCFSSCLRFNGTWGPDCLAEMHRDFLDPGFLLLDFLSSIERPACLNYIVP